MICFIRVGIVYQNHYGCTISGGGSGQGGGNMDYGFRNGMQQSHNNSWDDTMNINYGPPPILAGPPTGMPPGIPTIRGRGQMNNFGGGQQFNMPGRQYQQQNQQQQQQQQTQNLYMMGRGMYGGGGWGSPSHNPMPPNMSPGGWGGCQPRGGGRMGNSIGGSQRNKIFGAYGHHQQGGNQYKVRNRNRIRISLLFLTFFTQRRQC